MCEILFELRGVVYWYLQSVTGIHNGKSSEKLKKHNSPGSVPNLSGDIPATINDMETVRNQVQHMPENGNVMLFALFQLALAAVRSQEAFWCFFVMNVLD